MSAKPKPQTVRRFARELGVDLPEAEMDALIKAAIQSADWRQCVRDAGCGIRDAGCEKEEEADSEPAAADVQWVTVEVPVIELPDGPGYFTRAKKPRSLGSGSPIALSPKQSEAYARVFRAIEALHQAGEPCKLQRTSALAGDEQTRDAANPYDVLRLLLERVADAC